MKIWICWVMAIVCCFSEVKVVVAQQVSSVNKRILLIGNSFTFMNQGLDQHLKKMVPNSTVESITAGGFRLQQHLTTPATLDRIKNGRWDVVVLQEQSQLPVFDYATFSQAVKGLQRVILEAGAKPMLLMTWERPDSLVHGVSTENMLNVFKKISAQTGIQVSYAGYLFGKVKQNRPDIELYVNDGHPTLAGTYLASCVLYKSIFNVSPFSITYTAGLNKELASYLRLVASETVDFNK